jgi:hypothetical protein
MVTTSPLAAIRENCLECNGNALEVKLCPCTSCPMYPFRFGKNPYSKRTLTEEQREAAATRLKLARDKKGSSNDSI